MNTKYIKKFTQMFEILSFNNNALLPRQAQDKQDLCQLFSDSYGSYQVVSRVIHRGQIGKKQIQLILLCLTHGNLPNVTV